MEYVYIAPVRLVFAYLVPEWHENIRNAIERGSLKMSVPPSGYEGTCNSIEQAIAAVPEMINALKKDGHPYASIALFDEEGRVDFPKDHLARFRMLVIDRITMEEAGNDFFEIICQGASITISYGN